MNNRHDWEYKGDRHNWRWNEDFFNSNPPKNYEEIIRKANEMIRDMIQETENCEAIARFSINLWNKFCKTNQVGNVIAVM